MCFEFYLETNAIKRRPSVFLHKSVQGPFALCAYKLNLVTLSSLFLNPVLYSNDEEFA